MFFSWGLDYSACSFGRERDCINVTLSLRLFYFFSMVQTQQTQGTDCSLGTLLAGKNHTAMVSGAGPASTSACKHTGESKIPPFLPHLQSDGILKPLTRSLLLSSSIGFTWQGFYVLHLYLGWIFSFRTQCLFLVVLAWQLDKCSNPQVEIFWYQHPCTCTRTNISHNDFLWFSLKLLIL